MVSKQTMCVYYILPYFLLYFSLSLSTVATDASGQQQPSSVGAQAHSGASDPGPIRATAPMWRCSRIMHMQRELHPTLLSSLEGIVDQMVWFRENWHEEVRRTKCACACAHVDVCVFAISRSDSEVTVQLAVGAVIHLCVYTVKCVEATVSARLCMYVPPPAPPYDHHLADHFSVLVRHMPIHSR